MLVMRPCNFYRKQWLKLGCNPHPQIPRPLTSIPPQVIQVSLTSLPVRCDSDPKVHLVVSLLT